MADTSIEWASKVWNPVTGCDRVSPGCDHCYAMTMARRLKGMGVLKYQRDGDPRTSGPGFGVSIHPGVLGDPLKWRKPQRIFVNSMSDLFHDEVPDEYIARVWNVMRRCPQHTFQVLTKRHARMRSLLSSEDFQESVFALSGVSRRSENYRLYMEQYRTWPSPNIWLGVSTEDQKWANIRVPALLQTPAAARFISAEPLLGSIDLTHMDVEPHGAANGMYQINALTGRNTDMGRPCADVPSLDWVIVGGESGPGARPMHPRWAELLHYQCQKAGVPFLFKQWGEWTPMAPLDKAGRFDFNGSHAMTSDGNLYGPGDLTYPDGPRRGEAIRADFPHHHPTSMYRTGKKAAGRELYHDGRTFDEYPRTVAHA